MSPSRKGPWWSHSTPLGRTPHTYPDCAPRERLWGRTSLRHTRPPGSSGRPASRTSRQGRAGRRPATWPQGWAGESLQVHTLRPPPGCLPNGEPGDPPQVVEPQSCSASHTRTTRPPHLLVTWRAVAWAQRPWPRGTPSHLRHPLHLRPLLTFGPVPEAWVPAPSLSIHHSTPCSLCYVGAGWTLAAKCNWGSSMSLPGRVPKAGPRLLPSLRSAKQTSGLALTVRDSPAGHGAGLGLPWGQKWPGGQRSPVTPSVGLGTDAPRVQWNPALQGPDTATSPGSRQ